VSRADDMLGLLRRTFGDGPLYLVAGANDLVNEKLRELPDRLTELQTEYRDFPMRAVGALAGQAFRANLKFGELYDELTRRGEHVVAKMSGDVADEADDDGEPFVREPFMPPPLHRPSAAAPARKTATTKTTAKKATTKKAAAKKATAKKTATKKAAAKKATTKKTAAKKTTAAKTPTKKAPAAKRSAPRRSAPA
jgi:hypothetical protein